MYTHFYRAFLFSLFFIALLTESSSSWAQSSLSLRPRKGDLSLQAQSVKSDSQRQVLILEGEVEISFGDQTLKADKAELSRKTSEVTATGSVVLTSADTTIHADKIFMNYEKKTALVENGFVQSGAVVFEGRLIERKSETTYLVKEAQFTSCKTCPPAWSFTGQEIDAEVGGYADIKYPVLRVADFPVLILPRLLIPLKTERQSGVLTPSFELSKRGGAAYSQPFYWAINDQKDVTLTLIYYQNRGLKSHVEYRYVLDKDSEGILQTAYLKDRFFTEDGRSNSDPTSLYRSFVHYKHRYTLPNNIIQRTELNLVSDLRYVRDYPEEIEGHGDPALENNISFTQNTETQHRSIEAAYYVNLLQENAQSSNKNAVHRFPEINYNIIQQEIYQSGLFWQLDFNYVNFARKDFSYDDTTGTGSSKVVSEDRDGVYNPENDVIRTGQRMIVSPTVSYPFQIGSLFDVNPSVSYNEAQYRFYATPANNSDCPSNFDCGPSADLRFIQTDISVRTKTHAVFNKDEKTGNSFKHEIVPEVIYSTIPWNQRSDHIFFGDYRNKPYSQRAEEITNNDFFDDNTKLQFDYKDRLFDKEISTFILSNNIIRKRFVGDVATYHQLATFRLKQSYDFDEARREDPRPWSPINALLDIRGDQFETHTVADYYPYAKITNWSSRVRYTTLMKSYLELKYIRKQYVEQKNEKLENVPIDTEIYGLGLGFKTANVDLSGQANFSAVTRNFEGWQYNAALKPPGDCWAIVFEQRQTIGSDLKTKINMEFKFGG